MSVELAVPKTIRIPESTDDAAVFADALRELSDAGGWGTAALAYAFTEPDQGARSDLGEKSPRLTFSDFAALGIRGMSTRNTVRKYWQRWDEKVQRGEVEPATPGTTVTLPEEDFKLPRGSGDPDGDEWFTPAWLFDALGLVFSIDVCGPADRTHVSVPAESYYTPDDDGLSQPWTGTVWCNPPYSTPEPWARRMIAHGDGLLLTHMPMNAEWCVDVWRTCDGLRLFQAMDFVRPDGSLQRPGYWLQLAAFGATAADALQAMTIPETLNPRRVPSPMWGPA